jgi:hypothetical protein
MPSFNIELVTAPFLRSSFCKERKSSRSPITSINSFSVKLSLRRGSSNCPRWGLSGDPVFPVMPFRRSSRPRRLLHRPEEDDDDAEELTLSKKNSLPRLSLPLGLVSTVKARSRLIFLLVFYISRRWCRMDLLCYLASDREEELSHYR